MGTGFGLENVESYFFCMMMVVTRLCRHWGERSAQSVPVFQTSVRVFVRVESCGRALLKTGICS